MKVTIMTSKVFYDSYAILAFLQGDTQYKKIFEKSEGLTTYFQLMEVYYCILKNHSKQKADLILKRFSELLIEPELEDISLAMQFRHNNKKKKFSYADALGFIIAQRLNVAFVTGDESFKDVENVLFIKENTRL